MSCFFMSLFFLSLFFIFMIQSFHILRFSFIPVNRYIELAETAPEFLDVRIAVHAGTNDIRILFLYAPRKAAGTGTVAVARLVRQQAPENVHDEFSVFVQAYALRLSVF